MPFFIRGKRRSGRFQDDRKSRKKATPIERSKGTKFSEEIESDSDADTEKVEKKDEEELSEEEMETAQEKKLRLAKQYLTQLQTEEASKRDEEVDHVVISHRLKQDYLEQSGKFQRQVASSLEQPSPEHATILRGHQLSITCLVITPDDLFVFSASKDCSIIKWCVETGRKVHTIAGGRKGTEKTHVGHTAHILSMAISSDGSFLASGDRNRLIHIWRPSDCSLLHTFKGHWDAVSGLAFQHGTHQLFSASHDRSVRVWNVDDMAFIETLYGHQDQITDIDCLSRDRPVTTGGRDGSIRIWKIIEESQLVFTGHRGSIERVSLVNDQNFITGGEDNCLLLWNVSKKRPSHTRTNAHLRNVNDAGVKTETWISALTSFKYTDLVVSGSKDGHIRFWRCHSNMTRLDHLFEYSVVGFVNDVHFSKSGNFLAVAVGQEHKLGRWWRLKEAKNAVFIIKLTYNTNDSV